MTCTIDQDVDHDVLSGDLCDTTGDVQSLPRNVSLFTSGGVPVYTTYLGPRLYAFTAPEFNALNDFYAVKYGDTTRGVEVRVSEWEKKGPLYKDLMVEYHRPASFTAPDGTTVYIRDYSIHKYLVLHRYRQVITLAQGYHSDGQKMSQEFFIAPNGEVFDSKQVMEDAMTDIISRYGDPASPYSYYTTVKGDQAVTTYARTKTFSMRPFQQNAVDFASEYLVDLHSVYAVFLLAAPPRSGKSHMSLQIARRVCQDEKGHSLVVVVSGIADVANEWKENCESHVDFADFAFIDKKMLIQDPEAVQHAYESGVDNVVVFFTLQDLMGSVKGDVKAIHKFLSEVEVSLVISDEAHYAAFTEDGELRKVLDSLPDDVDAHTAGAKKMTKAIKGLPAMRPRYGRLFVTATPFSILSSDTSLFSQENRYIILESQMKEQARQWLLDNPDKPEYLSPFYGIPVRKCFVLDVGVPAREIFRVTNGVFARLDLVRDIFSGMFGQESSYPKVFTDPVYRDGGMGKGVMMTFSTCAECDAAEDEIKRIGGAADDYTVVNVSSGKGRPFSMMDTTALTAYLDSLNGKFIVITCDRMTTGVTIPKLDTVILCRSLTSAQKTVQTMGRVGTPLVERTVNESGEEFIFCDKSHTAVISFDRDAMLAVTYARATYDHDHSAKRSDGQDSADDLISDYLDAEEIFVFDPGKTQMVKATAADVISAVLSVESDGGLRSLAEKMNYDLSHLVDDEDLLTRMASVSAVGKNAPLSIGGFVVDPSTEDGVCKVKGCSSPVRSGVTPSGNPYQRCDAHQSAVESAMTPTKSKDAGDGEDAKSTQKDITAQDMDALLSKVRSVMVGMLMYAFLHPDHFDHVIDAVESASLPENTARARHLGVDADLIHAMVDAGVFGMSADHLMSVMQTEAEKDYPRTYDRFIQVLRSMRSFSPNEVPTEIDVAKMLTDKIDVDSAVRVIDGGCKSAVILVLMYEKMIAAEVDPDIAGRGLWCVPTSGFTYEFISAVYQAYGWDTSQVLFHDKVECVEMNHLLAARMQNTDLTEIFDRIGCSDKVRDEVMAMVDAACSDGMFDYCVSNPPYQDDSIADNQNPPIYHKFFNASLAFSRTQVFIVKDNWTRVMNDKNNKLHQWRDSLLADKVLSSVDFTGSVFPSVSVTTCIMVGGKGDKNTLSINGVEVSYPQVGSVILPSADALALDKVSSWDTLESRRVDYRMFARSRQALRDARDSGDRSGDTTVMGFIGKNRSTYRGHSSRIMKPGMDEFLSCKYKVAFADIRPWQQHDKGWVYELGDHEIPGEGFSCICFDTDEERKNYQKYIKTDTWRYFCLLSRANEEDRNGNIRFIPDLGDYTDSNPDINWDEPLDPQLRTLFGLDEQKDGDGETR